MGAIYDAESLAENATEGFQAGLRAPASQTSWLFASSSLFTNKRDRERESGLPSQCRDGRRYFGHSIRRLSHNQFLFQAIVLHPEHHML